MQNFTAGENNTCQFCQNSPVYAPAYVLNIVMSMPINCRVLWLMISSSVFWTDRMEVFEFHLVLTELISGILKLPILILSLTYIDDLHVTGVLGDMMYTSRILFQSAICVERYFAVVYPLMYRRFKPLRYRMSCGCVLLLQSFLFALILLYYCNTSSVALTMYIIQFIAVFIINSFCCVSVLMALKQPSPGEGEREGSSLIKKRAFNIVLILQLTIFFSYVPQIVVPLLSGRIEENTLCIWDPLAQAWMIFAGVVYPIFYLRRQRNSSNIRSN